MICVRKWIVNFPLPGETPRGGGSGGGGTPTPSTTPIPYESGASPYGREIPISSGTRVIEGEFIWSGDIVKVGDQNYVSFAVSFGQRGAPVDELPETQITRLWANGVLIYDRASLTGVTVLPGMTWRFYQGLEDQRPDPVIAAASPNGKAPAFRGLMYVLFENFPLELLKFTHIPWMRAELVDVPGNINPLFNFSRLSTLTTNPPRDNIAYDREFGFLYAFTSADEGVDDTSILRTFSIDGQNEIRQTYIRDQSGSIQETNGHLFAYLCPYSHLLITEPKSGQNSRPLLLIDPTTGRVKDSFGVLSNALSNTDTGFVATQYAASSETRVPDGHPYWCGQFVYLCVGGVFGEIGVLSIDKNTHEFKHIWHGSVAENIRHVCRGPIDDISWGCSFYVAHGSKISYFEVPFAAHRDPNARPVILRLAKDFGAGWHVQAMLLDESREALFVWVTKEDLSQTDFYRLWAGDGFNIGIETYHEENVPSFPNFSNNLLYQWDVSSGIVGWAYTSSNFAFLETDTGRHTQYNAMGTYHLNGDPDLTGPAQLSFTKQVWDGPSQSVFFARYSDAIGPGRQYIHRTFGGSILLSDIIRWFAMKGGYDESLILVENIPDLVIGSIINQRVGLWDVLDNMAKVFQFQYYESNGFIKFTRRLKGPDFTIDRVLTARDLALIDGDNVVRTISNRPDQASLPNQVEVSYIDPDADYGVSVVYARRTNFPARTTNSVNIIQYGVPIIMHSVTAFKYAYGALYSSWEGVNSYQNRLGPKHLDLEPTDIIQLPIGETTVTYQFQETTINADWSISVGGFEINSEVLNVAQLTLPTGEADFMTPRPRQRIKGPNAVTLLVLDTTLLFTSYEDVDGGLSSLVGVINYRAPFTSAELFRSPDRTIVDSLGTLTTDLRVGVVNSLLPDTSSPFVTDDDTQLLVSFINPEITPPVTITDLEFYNGVNMALVGDVGRWEVIFFRDVTDNGDGTYTLSHIARGRRGSEVFVGTHEIGDYLVMVDREAFRDVHYSVPELGETYFYRAAGYLYTYQDVSEIEVPVNGNAEKPWAPIVDSVVIDGSNDLTISWTPRTRAGYNFLNDADFHSLEDTEEYEVDILDLVSGAVLRTLTGITTRSTIYTAGQQSTDGFTPPLTSLRLRVYQMSSRVGRGFSRDVIIDVQ